METDSTASELAYELEQSRKELERKCEDELAERLAHSMTRPSVEESLAKFTALFEIQTMLKVAEEIKETAKASVDELFKRRNWDVANGMTRKALDKMNEILDTEEKDAAK